MVCPEGQLSPERQDIPQEVILISTGEGSPHVLKDELVRKSSLTEQRTLAGILGQKETLRPLEEGADNPGGLK